MTKKLSDFIKSQPDKATLKVEYLDDQVIMVRNPSTKAKICVIRDDDDDSGS